MKSFAKSFFLLSKLFKEEPIAASAAPTEDVITRVPTRQQQQKQKLVYVLVLEDKCEILFLWK